MATTVAMMVTTAAMMAMMARAVGLAMTMTTMTTAIRTSSDANFDVWGCDAKRHTKKIGQNFLNRICIYDCFQKTNYSVNTRQKEKCNVMSRFETKQFRVVFFILSIIVSLFVDHLHHAGPSQQVRSIDQKLPTND